MSGSDGHPTASVVEAMRVRANRLLLQKAVQVQVLQIARRAMAANGGKLQMPAARERLASSVAMAPLGRAFYTTRVLTRLVRLETGRLVMLTALLQKPLKA